MTEIFETIYKFLSAAGIPVYPENGVPTDAVLPYMTWNPVQTDWDSDGIMPVRIWGRSQNYRQLAMIADKLAKMLDDYEILRTATGYIYLYRGDPFIQAQPMQDSEIKILYVNIGITTMIP